MFDPTASFNTLVRQMLWPSFKALGYKKSGNNFCYYDPAGWGKIVQFQKSQWNSANELSFTVNVGLYLSDLERCYLSRESGAVFSESICAVRWRLGNLKGGNDEWHLLTEEANPEPVFTQLLADFQNVVLPYLAAITSREDIYALLVAGHRSHYLPAQIQAMYEAGYQEAARALFASEWRSAGNQYYRTTLHKLAERLEMPT